MHMVIKGLQVATRNDAWKLLTILTKNEYVYDSFRSGRAGYPVFYGIDIDKPNEYVCDLGDRIEVNYNDGVTQNIWF